MSYSDLNQFKTNIDSGVVYITIDNIPMNLVDMQTIQELGILKGFLTSDEEIKRHLIKAMQSGFQSPEGELNLPKMYETLTKN